MHRSVSRDLNDYLKEQAIEQVTWANNYAECRMTILLIV